LRAICDAGIVRGRFVGFDLRGGESRALRDGAATLPSGRQHRERGADPTYLKSMKTISGRHAATTGRLRAGPRKTE
jgi:hypothetical protein